jgi:hypothetical protein
MKLSSLELTNQSNRKALNDPKPGDYWQERLCPYLLIVDVSDLEITVLSFLPNTGDRFGEKCAKSPCKDKGFWDVDCSQYMVVDRKWLSDAVRYGTGCYFIADVSNTDATKNIVKEWKRFNSDNLHQQAKVSEIEGKNVLMDNMLVYQVEVDENCKRAVFVVVAPDRAQAITRALKYGQHPIIKTAPIPASEYWNRS